MHFPITLLRRGFGRSNQDRIFKEWQIFIVLGGARSIVGNFFPLSNLVNMLCPPIDFPLTLDLVVIISFGCLALMHDEMLIYRIL